MMAWMLRLFGLKIVYVCDWGTYESRYGSIDRMMTRPIHEDMSTAPPWAKMRIVKRTLEVS